MQEKLEQLEFILGKIIGIQKHPGKVRKVSSLRFHQKNYYIPLILTLQIHVLIFRTLLI